MGKNTKKSNKNKSNKNKKPTKETKTEEKKTPVVTKKTETKQNILKEAIVEDKDEIEKLKAKVQNLLKMNKYLLNEVEERKNIKNLKKEASDDLVNLIQKSDSPINFMQKKVLKVQEIVQDKIAQKDSNLQNAHKILEKNLDLLVENIQNDGITYVNTVRTEELDLGNLKLDVQKVLFNNPDSEIIVGSNILSLREMVDNMDLMEKLNTRCGVNMEKCIIYNEKVFEKEMANENRIIDGVKVLRKETLKMNKDKLRK